MLLETVEIGNRCAAGNRIHSVSEVPLFCTSWLEAPNFLNFKKSQGQKHANPRFSEDCVGSRHREAEFQFHAIQLIGAKPEGAGLGVDLAERRIFVILQTAAPPRGGSAKSAASRISTPRLSSEPSQISVQSSQAKLMDSIPSSGSQYDYPGLSDETLDLFKAAVDGDAEGVRAALAKGGDPNGRAHDDGTPLHWAAARHHAECVEILEPLTEVDPCDIEGATPLMNAVSTAPKNPEHSERATRCVELLLRRADPMKADREDWTPLMLAAASGQAMAAKLLLPVSDPLARNDCQEDALIVAARMGNGAVIEILAPESDPKARSVSGLNAMEALLSQKSYYPNEDPMARARALRILLARSPLFLEPAAGPKARRGALAHAAGTGRLDCAQILAPFCLAELASASNGDSHPLRAAANAEQWACVKFLAPFCPDALVNELWRKHPEGMQWRGAELEAAALRQAMASAGEDAQTEAEPAPSADTTGGQETPAARRL